MNIFRELLGLVEAFDAAGVEYALCGGMAVAVHGLVRATKDIDVLVPEDQLDKARRVALDRSFTFEAHDMWFDEHRLLMKRLSKADPASGDLLSLDILVVNASLEEAWRTRMLVTVDETNFWVVSREALIGLKAARGNAQDRADIEFLRGNGA
jgi:hypothetical protein